MFKRINNNYIYMAVCIHHLYSIIGKKERNRELLCGSFILVSILSRRLMYTVQCNGKKAYERKSQNSKLTYYFVFVRTMRQHHYCTENILRIYKVGCHQKKKKKMLCKLIIFEKRKNK